MAIPKKAIENKNNSSKERLDILQKQELLKKLPIEVLDMCFRYLDVSDGLPLYKIDKQIRSIVTSPDFQWASQPEILCNTGFFNERLPKDPKSSFLDQELFPEKELQEIIATLIKAATEKFKEIPSVVLKSMLSALMYSRSFLTVDGYLSTNRVNLCPAFIKYGNKYFSLPGNKAFTFLSHQLAIISDKRWKEIRKQKDKKDKAEAFASIKNHSNFIAHLEHLRDNYGYPNDPLETWNENLIFYLNKPKDMAKEIQEGTFKFILGKE